MILDQISANPSDALVSMERYVNDGSPSGFSFTHTTSAATCPRSSVDSFRLHVVTARAGTSIRELGIMPAELDCGEGTKPMFVHPDMIGDQHLMSLACSDGRLSNFSVEPLSSGRTVRIRSNSITGYLKLHYGRHIGRIRRPVSLERALAVIENDEILTQLIETGKMPPTFAFFREPGVRLFCGETGEWGMIWRPPLAYGTHVARICYVVPAFSRRCPGFS